MHRPRVVCVRDLWVLTLAVSAFATAGCSADNSSSAATGGSNGVGGSTSTSVATASGATSAGGTATASGGTASASASTTAPASGGAVSTTASTTALASGGTASTSANNTALASGGVSSATGGSNRGGGTSSPVGGTSATGGSLGTATGGTANVSGASGAGVGGASKGGANSTAGASGVTGAFTLTSPSHADGAKFASKYTCADAGFDKSIMPKLDWTPGPQGTKSYAITFIDTTLAPGNMNGYHWVVYNIPATTLTLPEGFKDAATVGAKQNSAFLGPCPNFGSSGSIKTDSYEFTLYALATDSITISGTGTAAVKDAATKLEASHLAAVKLKGTSDAAPPK